jgi:hypothetical protein
MRLSQRVRKWSHKKFKNCVFKGSYHKFKGERIFVLKCEGKPNQEFSSHHAAKSAGWVSI